MSLINRLFRTDREVNDVNISHLGNVKIPDVVSFLEIGCGNGYITEYISDKTRASLIGIDLANEAIERANRRVKNKSNRLTFVAEDIQNLDYEEGAFDAIISIDSLYFLNLPNTLDRLNNVLKPGGKMFIFYHFPPSKDNNKSDLAEKSRFGQLLMKEGFDYRAIDFTEANYNHWQLKEKVLENLEDEFEEEGNSFLFNNQMIECRGGLENFTVIYF